MDMAATWQICLQFEYDRAELILGLEEWLHSDKSLRLLDCACGTGFPALDLIQRGYDITCTDGSARMLAEFDRNAVDMGIKAKAQCIEWSDLSKYFGRVFDIVLCRGSSLIYAGAWDDEGHPDEQAITEALQNFRECLKIGGLLYLDTTAAENLTKLEPEKHVYPETLVGSHRVSLTEMVYTDRDEHLRTWTIELNVDGVTYVSQRHSYYLPHSKLIELLEQAGFVDIYQTKIRGEHYDVFVARVAAR